MKAGDIHQIRCVLKTRQTKWMAHVLCAFIVILCLTVPALAAKKRSPQKRKPSPKKTYPASENQLVNEMLKHLGVRYRPGGSSPSGVDCSGYVGLVYRNAYGLTLPHQSKSLYSSSDLEEIPLDDLKTGDLLFFTSSKRSKRISHVGIYLPEGKFVHAASGKGVIVSSLDEQYWSERIAGARRIPELAQLKNGDAAPIEFSALGASMGTLSDYREPAPYLSVVSHSLGMEFGQNRDFQVSLFQDSFFSSKGTDSEYSFHDDSMGLDGRPLLAHVQGIRVERDIRPFPWLIVTPSLSYFDYDGGLDEASLPRGSVGLDLSLGSREDAWRISTGFHYLSLIHHKGYAEEQRAPEGIDMSLTYSRRLSDGLSIFLIGERLQRYEAVSAEFPREDRTFEDQRFSVLFNFSY
ncbi:MAG: hypothetical protein CVU57_10005 [Deltaproteobacteria bacterium HGW-Deltaproteobacteria-15]|nr:MAG: hypothetical protein CVU57_10005 [Deltaproteobacteria bacterium HGW-Deltaproteobacteria-15]